MYYFFDDFGFFILIAVIVSFVILFKRTSKLKDRVLHMEKYLQDTTKDLGADTDVADTESIEGLSEEQQLRAQMAALGTPIKQKSSPMEKQGPGAAEKFIAWLKNDWLMKLGGLLIILGFAWFLSYAFSHGWIGPAGQIALGFAISAGVLVLGRYRITAYVSQGGILMFVGALGVVLTTWIARGVHGFFTPASALAIMFLTSCVLGATSITFKRLPLAYANIGLAAVAPLLTVAPLDAAVFLSYLFVLSLGSIWVAAVTGWRQLIAIALLIVGIYSMTLIPTLSTAELDIGLMFSFVFTALFFGTSVVGMRVDKKTRAYDLFVGVMSGIFLLGWIFAAVAEEWQSMLLIAWTIVFAFGAFAAIRLGGAIEFFYTYAGVGVVLLGVATAIELDGPALTIAALIEALIILLVGYRITKKANAVPMLALPSIVPIMLSLGSMSSYAWGDSILHEDSLVLLLIIGSGVGVAKYFKFARLNESEEDRMQLSSIANTAGSLAAVYGIIYIWLAVHALVEGEWGLIVTLLIYIGIGSALYVSGKQTGEKWKRVIGGVLIGLTSVYLLLVAGAILGQFGRIVAYILIGAILVTVAWHERSSVHGPDEKSNNTTQ